MADGNSALHDLTQALNAIYDPRSTNDIRRDATVFLDTAKTHPQAAVRGFTLASDPSQPPQNRHFGLTLLEYIVKYRWDELDEKDAESYKEMIVELGYKISNNEPAYIRNKVAQLWVDLAERVWLDSWLDLDSHLIQLWQTSFAHQMMSLYILQLLSEDAFLKGEQGDGLHGGNLGKACTEIFTPAKVFAELFPSRDHGMNVRSGDEGWLVRLLDRLSWCCGNLGSDLEAKSCAVQVLVTIQSVMPWMLLKVVAVTDCNALLGRCLQTGDLEIQIATLDVLLTLLHRTQFLPEDITQIICPLMTEGGLKLVQALLDSSKVNIDDVDEQYYLLRKKLAEVARTLADYPEAQPSLVVEHIDLLGLLDLVEIVFLDPSLVVSIPALYIWSRLLDSTYPPIIDAVSRKYSVLLDTCSKRVLRFGNLPDDSQDETFRFLQIDFDTMPERHAFAANYRRYCLDVIEKIVRTSPFEALHHFLSQTNSLLDSLPNDAPSLSAGPYNDNSYAALRVDAQCTVVASAVKSYCKWISETPVNSEDHRGRQAQTQQNIQHWCHQTQSKFFHDPAIQKRVLQLVGELVMSVVDVGSTMPLATFRSVLGKIFTGKVEATLYGDSLKELNFACTRLLQKLTIKFANVFIDPYADLESEIRQLFSVDSLDRRVKTDLRAVLFLILHRTSKAGDDERMARMEDMMRVVIEPWQDPSFTQAATSFEAFCKFLGFENMPDYFLSRGAHNFEDWSLKSLDQQGLDMREDIVTRTETLPLHVARSILTASTDKVRQGSREQHISVNVWDTCIPVILPTLVPLLGHAHGFGNPTQWSGFPVEMQTVLQKILTDRVWQSGISSESRDDFYERVRKSRNSLEGLGSAIRAAVRSVRELSYWILHCFAQFGDALYRHHDLAEPLARAMYENADALSSHQVSTLIQITQALIDGCPIGRRHEFLPPLLRNLFVKVDQKLTLEWERTDKRERSEMNDETLDQEMKAESVLRSLTYTAVSLACTLLQPPQHGKTGPSALLMKAAPWAYTDTSPNHKAVVDVEPLSNVTFGDPRTLSSIVMFCSHVIRMRDTRSCLKVTNLFRHLLPELGRSETGLPSDVASELREFFASEMLKSAISSFHEPYFTDLQRDLAILISNILVICSNFTDTPRQVMLSLPNMSPGKVNKAFEELSKAKNERERGRLILKLLENLRGVSIHEIGKMTTPTPRNKRKTIQEQYMKMDDDSTQIRRGGSPEPGAMTDLFG